MNTFWDSFIDQYRQWLMLVPIRQMLSAFWHFCNGEKSECDKIMKEAQTPPNSRVTEIAEDINEHAIACHKDSAVRVSPKTLDRWVRQLRNA